MTEVHNVTLRGTSVMPSLTVNDLQKSLEFFARLGFEVQDKWEHEGVQVGAMLRAGDVSLGLSQDDGKKGRDRIKGVGLRLYIETADDIDALAARAKAAGLILAREPYDSDRGSRVFEVTEPSGFAFTIAARSAT